MEEQKEESMELCPRHFWMSKTSSFWDEEMIDEDYDRLSEEEEVLPSPAFFDRDFVKIMNILTPSTGKIIEDTTSGDEMSVMMSEDEDEELCRLCKKVNTKNASSSRDSYMINETFVPRSSQDPTTPKTPVPVKESEDQELLNEPPQLNRRCVRFWDDAVKNQEETNKSVNGVDNKGNNMNQNVDRRRRSSDTISPLTVNTSTTMTSVTATPPSPPVFTMIPPPTVRRIVPMTRNYHIVKMGPEPNDEKLERDFDDNDIPEDVIVDFDLSMIEQLRRSAEHTKRAQETSRLELETALNMFRLSNTSTDDEEPEESRSGNCSTATENTNNFCPTEETVAESLASTIPDIEEVNRKPLIQNNNGQRCKSMVEVPQMKQEWHKMQNQQYSKILLLQEDWKLGRFSILNKHTAAAASSFWWENDEPSHEVVVPPLRRQTIHIAMAA